MNALPSLIPITTIHEQLLNVVGQAVFTFDRAGKITCWNRAAEDIYGWSSHDVIGRDLLEIIAAESRQDVAAGVLQSLSAAGSWTSGRYLIRRRDGSTRPVMVLDAPLFDEVGGLAAVVGVSCISSESGIPPNSHDDSHDVGYVGQGPDSRELYAESRLDARRRAESALRKSEALYRTMVETAHEGVWLLDSEARTTFVNASMASMLGYSADEMAGRVFLDFVHDQDRPAGASRFTRRRQGLSESYDIRFRRSDGSVFWALISGSPFYDDAGRFAGSLGLLTDITARKRYEEGLIEAKEKAEELAHLKSALLTNMSHEIRTPLTGILGFAEMIAADSTGDVREYAEFINQSGERLMETLNSVLELAQLESRSMHFRPEPVDVVEHAGELLPAFERFAEKKGLYLRLEHSRPCFMATVDRSALSRVLVNLINNALKFTNHGGVTVRLDCEEGQVRIDVADTGIGIEAAFIPKLFDDFEQASAGVSRCYEGVGLGLSITKRLVELMNGTIDVLSVRGAGSTFTVRLPMDPQRLGSPLPAST